MAKLLALVCVLVTLFGVSNTSARHHANPPVAVPSSPPSVDCSTVIFDLIECVSFLVEGSNESKPEASCCIAYESVVSVSDECICVAINQSPGMGIELNLTKVVTLPTACGMPAFPIAKCHVNALAPGPGPSGKNGRAPSPGPMRPRSPPPAPVTITEEAPAPAPAPSQAHSISVSFVIFIISMLVVYGFNASN